MNIAHISLLYINEYYSHSELGSESKGLRCRNKFGMTFQLNVFCHQTIVEKSFYGFSMTLNIFGKVNKLIALLVHQFMSYTPLLYVSSFIYKFLECFPLKKRIVIQFISIYILKTQRIFSPSLPYECFSFIFSQFHSLYLL